MTFIFKLSCLVNTKTSSSDKKCSVHKMLNQNTKAKCLGDRIMNFSPNRLENPYKT